MKVLVATPVMRGELFKRAWMSWYAMDWDGQVDYFQMLGGDDAPLPYDNVVGKYNDARTALLCGDYDALLTIESDTIVPKDTLTRLVAMDTDVAYGLYVWRHGFPWWTAYTIVEEAKGQSLSGIPEKAKELWGQVIETQGVGNGCTLITRQVMEAIEFKWSMGEFGCCDWHLSLDCQRLGFVQKHDLGLICGHIATDPLHRILWPDAEAEGLYRTEMLGAWNPLPKHEDDKWLTGTNLAEPAIEGAIVMDGTVKMEVLQRFHWKDGIYADPGQVISVSEKTAERLERRGMAKLVEEKRKRRKAKEGDLEPGLKLKEPCGGCDEKK